MNPSNIRAGRPKLHLPKALLAAGANERRLPTLSRLELRAIVTELLG